VGSLSGEWVSIFRVLKFRIVHTPNGTGSIKIKLSNQFGISDCHGSDGKVPDSAVMTTRAGSILVMDYS
jgi:hypothetical protein